MRVPCSTPALPPANRAAWRPRDDRLAAGLDADQPHAGIVDKGVEDAHRVAAAADAGDDRVRQLAGQLEDLRARLPSDHRLEFADHQRIRMRPQHRAEQIVGVGDVGDPVAHRLVDGVLQRPAAGIDAQHLGAQQTHAERR